MNRTLTFGLMVLLLSVSACGGSSKGRAPHPTQGSTPMVDVIADEQVNPEVPAPQESPDTSPTNPTNPTNPAPSTDPSALPTNPYLNQAPAANSGKTLISGRITYDRVPFAQATYQGLDYARTYSAPARGITVQILDSQDRLHATTTTDSQGYYRFEVASQQTWRLQALAELRDPRYGSWDIRVRDNTDRDALYILRGSATSAGSSAVQIRHLHAASGWSGSGYHSHRSAAPFAILDSLFDAVQLVKSADANVLLPPLTVYWSERNIAIQGNLTQGHIFTSHYSSDGPAIYLLGAADNDADEFDRAVIQHEFGHYLEDQLSRTDSIGGDHSLSSHLDMRVAFSEAWGNVFAAMAAQDPVYRDSMGLRQNNGFGINVERSGKTLHQLPGPVGWYSEASLQALLYDLFDDEQDDSDLLALGFNALYQVFVSPQYLNFPGFASIFPFVETLRQQRPDIIEPLNTMLREYDINGIDGYGEDETNNSNSPYTLPIYHPLAVGQTLNACSDQQFQEFNGVDVRRYVRLSITQPRNYTLRAVRNERSRLSQTNPQMVIHRQGQHWRSLLSNTLNQEHTTQYFDTGQYVIELYEEANVDNRPNNGGLACFDLSIH